MDGLGPSRCRDGNYGLSIADLRNINEQKGPEAVDLIQNKYGGVVEVCKLLFTSPNEGKIIRKHFYTKHGNFTYIYFLCSKLVSKTLRKLQTKQKDSKDNNFFLNFFHYILFCLQNINFTLTSSI